MKKVVQISLDVIMNREEDVSSVLRELDDFISSKCNCEVVGTSEADVSEYYKCVGYIS